MSRNKPFTVTCPYCGQPAKLVDSAIVYHGRSYGMIWYCAPCSAWVGCHRNSRRHCPLGRLANAELREAKKAAHAAFDPLWQAVMVRDKCGQTHARRRAYTWLAKQLGITLLECHIGKFNLEQCDKVVAICSPIGRRGAST